MEIQQRRWYTSDAYNRPATTDSASSSTFRVTGESERGRTATTASGVAKADRISISDDAKSASDLHRLMGLDMDDPQAHHLLTLTRRLTRRLFGHPARITGVSSTGPGEEPAGTEEAAASSPETKAAGEPGREFLRAAADMTHRLLDHPSLTTMRDWLRKTLRTEAGTETAQSPTSGETVNGETPSIKGLLQVAGQTPLEFSVTTTARPTPEILDMAPDPERPVITARLATEIPADLSLLSGQQLSFEMDIPTSFTGPGAGETVSGVIRFSAAPGPATQWEAAAPLPLASSDFLLEPGPVTGSSDPERRETTGIRRLLGHLEDDGAVRGRGEGQGAGPSVRDAGDVGGDVEETESRRHAASGEEEEKRKGRGLSGGLAAESGDRASGEAWMGVVMAVVRAAGKAARSVVRFWREIREDLRNG